MSTIGDSLKRARLAMAMTQTDVAGIEFSPGYVSRIEAGLRRPSDRAIRYFAERLGIDPGELLAVAAGADPGMRREIGQRLMAADTARAAGSADQAVTLYKDALLAAEEAQLRDLHALALIGLGQASLDAGDLESALARFGDAIALGVPPEAAVQAHALAAEALLASGQAFEATVRLRPVFAQLAERSESNPRHVAQVAAVLARALSALGTDGEAERVVSDGLQRLGGGQPRAVAVALWELAQSAGEVAPDALSQAQGVFDALTTIVEAAQLRLLQAMVSGSGQAEVRDALGTVDFCGTDQERLDARLVAARAVGGAEASRLLDEAEKLARSDSERARIAETRIGVDAEQGERELEILAGRLAERQPLYARRAWRAIGKARRGRGDTNGAVEAYEKALGG